MKSKAIIDKLLEADQFDARAYLMAVQSYWDIYVSYGATGLSNDDGYSAFVALPMPVPKGGQEKLFAPDDPEAMEVVKMAADMSLFDLSDARNVDYVANLTREGYRDMTGK